jgi:hypothetical protein
MTNYRVVKDEHGDRILRDGQPITLEQAVIELHALQGELDAAAAALTAALLHIAKVLRHVLGTERA